MSFLDKTAHFAEIRRGGPETNGKLLRRKLIAHPKLYFFDAGVYRALRPRGPIDSAEDIDGAAVETLALETLRAEIANRALGHRLYFWRTFDGKEVASSSTASTACTPSRSSVPPASASPTSGLRAFCADYPEAKACLLCGGRQLYRFGNIDVVPLGEGLAEMGERLA